MNVSRVQHTTTKKLDLSLDQRKALRALLYFDLFNYPLKLDEIKLYSSLGKSSDIKTIVNTLVEEGLVVSTHEFYLLSAETKNVQSRINGNRAAEKMMVIAKRMSRFISRFPFVRMVAISGSLSKGYSDELGDIDYFIVTKPGRLWIARSILIAFKKVFLLNSKKYFCVNYFIDTDHLEIPDKNIFTATEVLTLEPMYDPDVFQAFIGSNLWASEFLPNASIKSVSNANPKRNYIIKSFIEFCLNGRFGEALDAYLMKLTMNKWQKKFNHFTPEYFEHALRSRKYVSKHHPQNFQKKVLDSLDKRILDFETQYGLSLDLTNG